jgi:hypothetical protein
MPPVLVEHPGGACQVSLDLNGDVTVRELVATAAERLRLTERRHLRLSHGPLKLDPQLRLAEVLARRHAGAVFQATGVVCTLTDFSTLRPDGADGAEVCRIEATEHRGITLEQLCEVKDFVARMAPAWCETFEQSPAYGERLRAEVFNLYHADLWLIRPSTEDHGVSFVEFITREPWRQRPQWFVSHAWIEPVINFVACIRMHAFTRELSLQVAYWVCAYANNQHHLSQELVDNPRRTSFYRAMKACVGVVLVLDGEATPFSRIWCCFEEAGVRLRWLSWWDEYTRVCGHMRPRMSVKPKPASILVFGHRSTAIYTAMPLLHVHAGATEGMNSNLEP